MEDCFMRCQPVEGGGDERFYMMAMMELTIYGHTIDAWVKEKYPEDWEHVQHTRHHGSEWACWHSVACPDGEIGSNEVGMLRPITYDAFVQAAEQGWPYSSDHTTLAPVAAVGYVNEVGDFVWDWSSLDETLGARNQG